jgi:hypothetical protein
MQTFEGRQVLAIGKLTEYPVTLFPDNNEPGRFSEGSKLLAFLITFDTRFKLPPHIKHLTIV